MKKSNPSEVRRINALAVLLSVAASVSFVLLSLSPIRLRSSGDVVFVEGNATDYGFEARGGALTSTERPGACSDRPPAAASSLGLTGDAPDCACTFDDIERTNLEGVHPLLGRIVETPFFAHFKVDLCAPCELWDDAPLCVLRDCGVCECDDAPDWAREVDWAPEHATAVDGDDCGHVDDRVVTTVDSRVSNGWTSAAPTPFFEEREPSPATEEDAAVVVDLRLNPERYTGYSGQSAEKVWTAIHRDNCFRHGDDGSESEYCDLPADQRVYNRIISGMHSSISLHIAHSYCLEMDPDRIAECRTWGSNVALAKERVLDRKDRIENLYVAFAVMLRAAQRAGPAIAAAVPAEDPLLAEGLREWTDELLPELTRVMESCPLAFDESVLFAEASAASAESRRSELGRRFRHLMRIMKCVGCDRCRLWGTLQTLGVGTALRIILEEEESRAMDLTRQEAVALVHTLERFSSALVYSRELALMPENAHELQNA